MNTIDHLEGSELRCPHPGTQAEGSFYQHHCSQSPWQPEGDLRVHTLALIVATRKRHISITFHWPKRVPWPHSLQGGIVKRHPARLVFLTLCHEGHTRWVRAIPSCANSHSQLGHPKPPWQRIHLSPIQRVPISLLSRRLLLLHSINTQESGSVFIFQ